MSDAPNVLAIKRWAQSIVKECDKGFSNAGYIVEKARKILAELDEA